MNRLRAILVAGALVAGLAVPSAQGGYYPPPPANPPAPPPPPPPTAVTYALSVAKDGTGGGTVTSTPGGIACGSDCSESYAAGTIVTLAAVPDGGSSFAGWSGACTGVGGCSVTVDSAKTVTASFATAATPAADTAVAARLVRVSIARDARGRRVVQMRLSADEQLRVEIRLVRGSKSLAKRTLAAFAAGQRTVKLVVPSDVSGGRARVLVAVGDEAGNTDSFTRSLRLPAPA